MPQTMADSNEDQDHNDNYFETSRMFFPQEMTMQNMKP